MIKFLLSLLLGSLTIAQTITVSNPTAYKYTGYVRVPMSYLPIHLNGWDNTKNTRYFRYDDGVDLYTALNPFQTKTLDLNTFTKVVVPKPQIPGDIVAFYGGLPTVNNAPLTVVTHEVQGAGVFAHLTWYNSAERYTIDIKGIWYGGQPGWCKAKATFTPDPPPPISTTQQVFEPIVLQNPVVLDFGSAFVFAPNQPLGVVLGQGAEIIDKLPPISVLYVWPSYITTQAQWDSLMSEWFRMQ